MKVLTQTDIEQVSGAGAFKDFLVGITETTSKFAYTCEKAFGTLKNPTETSNAYVARHTQPVKVFSEGVESFFQGLFGNSAA